MRRFRRFSIVLASAAVAAGVIAPAARATFPYPSGSGSGVYDYSRFHISNGSCTPLAAGQTTPPGSDLPPGFDCRNDTKLTDYAAQPGDADYDPAVANNPQELFGVKGAGTNKAWEVTTGRPDTIIAVMDSGILWNEASLVNKVHINTGELPVPCLSSSSCSTRTYSSNWKDYDVNHDGVVNIVDYAHDPRVTDANHNGLRDPEDLILVFSDGIDHDKNGYVNDIAGWDFYQNDNDPADDVTYGHGTGEANDSSAEIGQRVAECFNCTFEPLRVGDSFIAQINHWAEGVIYAVDNGVSIVQEALGTINHTGFAQVAADYAYQHGVLIVASEADEEAGHHNYPAALNHTMVVNSVTHYVDDGQQQVGPAGVAVQNPKSYLAFNGCTNYGGYTWTSVESNSCSSDATGQASGIAGLLYSAARNAVQQGKIAPGPSGRPLSAEEAKQLFRLAADDVDFSTPKPPGPPNNFATTLPDSQRYITTAGWDQITGWGRLNADTLVHLVAAGKIPPEADITGPDWWQPLDTSGTVNIVGSVAAPRASTYTYELQFAPGVQPPRWPASETWTTFATGAGSRPKSGSLGQLDLAAVRAAIDAAPPVYTPADDPTSRDLPEKDAFRVRVVVHANGSSAPEATAIEQRQYFSVHDADLMTGFPTFLNADGAGAPAFADIDGDGVSELVISDGNGYVHAYKADGRHEAKGFPVHTDPVPLPAAVAGRLRPPVYQPILLGSPAVADLTGSGWPDIAVADSSGALHLWDHTGKELPGFPVHVNPAYSHVTGCQVPGAAPLCDAFSAHPVRDHVNTVDSSFTSAPAVAHLDPAHPGADLVVGANDGHVYAFHNDGTPVPGWPVLTRDPTKVASVDPVSHFVTFKPDAKPFYGKQVITTPSVGPKGPDGRNMIAVNVDEEYNETPNWSLRDPSLQAIGAVATPGNTRTYLLWGDGTAHPGPSSVANLGDNAYVPGWPAKIGMLETELLPDVGSGSDGPPVFTDVNGDGTPEIATASIASPPYLLKLDGSSFYGNGPDGRYLTMASLTSEFKNPTATDGPSVGSLGGLAAGRLAGPSSPVSVAMGSTGLRRLLDVVLPDQQLGAEDHLGAWDAATGTYEPGFPAQMNDLQFFNTPAIADIDGSGLPSVIQGSAVYDLRAYQLGGVSPSGWPKFTGGWVVTTPGVGDLVGDGGLEVAMSTREGNLFVWRTKGSVCGDMEWPKFQHDLANSGNLATDASPPAVVGKLKAVRSGNNVTLSWVAPGDDGHCGTASGYKITVDGAAAASPAPTVAGSLQSLTLAVGKGHTISVQAVDDAGNRGIPKTLRI